MDPRNELQLPNQRNMERTSEITLCRPTSSKVAQRILAVEGRAFENCYWGIRVLPGRAWLVIGLVDVEGTTHRHAWIEWSNRIVDPTLVYLVPGDMSYFPMHRYSKNQVRKLPILASGLCGREPSFHEWYEIKVSAAD